MSAFTARGMSACCCVGMALTLAISEHRRRRLSSALSRVDELSAENELAAAHSQLALEAANDELAAAQNRITHISAALDKLNRAQRGLELCALPALPDDFVPSDGWKRCMAALEAVGEGYSRFSGSRHKTTLISNFVGSPQKSHVDALLAQHVKRCFPDIGATLLSDPALILLLLDAPDCGSAGGLLEAIPALSAHATRVCIAQADPSHYSQQIAADASAVTPSATACHLFNIRCQRLDQWLVSNRGAGLRVAVCFADFETSIYGKPRSLFSPLRDLQLFLRLGYAHKRCLLGVTLGFREPHDSRYAPNAPILGVEDLSGFVVSEGTCSPLAPTTLSSPAQTRWLFSACVHQLKRLAPTPSSSRWCAMGSRFVFSRFLFDRHSNYCKMFVLVKQVYRNGFSRKNEKSDDG